MGYEATHMNSLDGETVPFLGPIALTGQVEVGLNISYT